MTNPAIIRMQHDIGLLDAEARLIRRREKKMKNHARRLKRRANQRNNEEMTKTNAARWIEIDGARAMLHWRRTAGHRRNTRHHYLAYAFVRGVPYNRVESAGCYEPPNFDRVLEIARSFLIGVPDDSAVEQQLINQSFQEWADAATIRDLNEERASVAPVTPSPSQPSPDQAA